MNVEDADAVIRSMAAGIGYEKLKPSQMQAVGRLCTRPGRFREPTYGQWQVSVLSSCIRSIEENRNSFVASDCGESA